MNEQQIGQRLVKARGVITQKDLASSMRDRGYKWSQATVWSVERGERPLRLSEAVHVAAILGYKLDWLAGANESSPDAAELRELRHFNERVDAAYRSEA